VTAFPCKEAQGASAVGTGDAASRIPGDQARLNVLATHRGDEVRAGAPVVPSILRVRRRERCLTCCGRVCGDNERGDSDGSQNTKPLHVDALPSLRERHRASPPPLTPR
jgi:hypothetical protein